MYLCRPEQLIKGNICVKIEFNGMWAFNILMLQLNSFISLTFPARFERRWYLFIYLKKCYLIIFCMFDRILTAIESSVSMVHWRRIITLWNNCQWNYNEKSLMMCRFFSLRYARCYDNNNKIDVSLKMNWNIPNDRQNVVQLFSTGRVDIATYYRV